MGGLHKTWLIFRVLFMDDVLHARIRVRALHATCIPRHLLQFWFLYFFIFSQSYGFSTSTSFCVE